MDHTHLFEAERPRLERMATQVLGDHAEAQDVVQQAWLRLHGTDARIEVLPAWLTTVTTRLCLDRLRARTPVPMESVDLADPVGRAQDVDGAAHDPAHEVVLAESVGRALHVVLDRLTPRERVALVLHDSFDVDFTLIAAVLDTSPVAARKLASRARSRLADPPADPSADSPADPPAEPPSRSGPVDWEVVDAFMAAARDGDFDRLLSLLAPGATVGADHAAVLMGTPQRIEGREEVAAFFDGSARSALPVLLDDRPGSGWFHRGAAKVVFDFTVADGLVLAVTFRAEPDVLARAVRRDGASARR